MFLLNVDIHLSLYDTSNIPKVKERETKEMIACINLKLSLV